MNITTVTYKLNPTHNLKPLNLDKIQYIVIHHTDSSSATWEDINKWHKEKGWDCAGYNAFINKKGEIYILRGDNIGAQCLNYNSTSYGIALEGNFENEFPTEEQYNTLINYIISIKHKFKFLKTIVPHSYLFDTTCPGKNFNMIRILSEFDQREDITIENALAILTENKLINSPDYWMNVILGKEKINIDYLKTIIINFIKFIKK